MQAAKILMKILYAARMARFDLLRVVASLATELTRWTEDCDRRLHRLVCYIWSTKHYRLIGVVADPPSSLSPHLFADADFAGGKRTMRSTSGAHLALHGPRTFFPLHGLSKRQTAASHSTPEAEMVAAAMALRTIGIPSLDLWSILLERPATLTFHEDNEAMIKVCRTGKNPTMRHINCVHGVSAVELHERFSDPQFKLVYEKSALRNFRSACDSIPTSRLYTLPAP